MVACEPPLRCLVERQAPGKGVVGTLSTGAKAATLKLNLPQRRLLGERERESLVF